MRSWFEMQKKYVLPHAFLFLLYSSIVPGWNRETHSSPDSNTSVLSVVHWPVPLHQRQRGNRINMPSDAAGALTYGRYKAGRESLFPLKSNANNFFSCSSIHLTSWQQSTVNSCGLNRGCFLWSCLALMNNP